MQKRHKERLFSLILVLFVVLLGIPLMEVALRVVAPQPQSWFDLFRRQPGKPLFEVEANLNRLIDTGDTKWRVVTDKRGFRTSEKPKQAPKNAPRLMVLGDSFGFAYGVHYEDSFAGMIDVATGTTARIINASVPGYGPLQYRIRLEELLAEGFSPSAVLVPVYGGNDYNDCVWDKDVKVVDGLLGGKPYGWRGWAKLNMHLYRLVSKVLHRFMGAPRQNLLFDLYTPDAWSKPFLGKAYKVMKAELGKIKSILDKRGIDLFVVYIPTVESVNDAAKLPRPEPLKDLQLQLPRDKFMEMAKALNLKHADSTDAMAKHGGQATYFNWNRHLRPKGNEVFTQFVLKEWGTLKSTLHRAAQR